MCNSTQPFPNPDTYLNHLTPGAATQFEVGRIIQTAFLGALIWDVLAFISDDVKMLRHGGGLVTISSYFLARIFATVYVTLRVVTTARPVSHCQTMMICTNLACVLTMATSSYLFLKRAQAVYSGNRLAHWGFALAYVGGALGNVLLLFGVTTKHIPGTGYCTTYKVELYASISYFMSGLFDALVFFAISYKIAYQAHRSDLGTDGSRATRLFTSKTLPVLSKAILQGGQQYYLIGLSSQLTALIMTFTPSVPPLYRTVFMPPSVAVTAVMVCRVHRHMALAFHNPDGEVSGLQTRVVASIRFAHTQPASGDVASHVVIGNFPEIVDPPNRKVIEENVGGSSGNAV